MTPGQLGHSAHHNAPSGRYIPSTIIPVHRSDPAKKLPSPCGEVLFSVATLIQSRSLFLQARLEHTVRSSLPSRWARERPGPRGQTLYLKLNDWAEIHQAKAVHLTILFTKLASDIPAQIGDLSPWHGIFIFFGRGLNLTFTQQSTHVSTKFLLAGLEEAIFFPKQWDCPHVELELAFT